ncbi:hypothetical protein D3C83_75240 [compost metagenome]
MAVISSFSSPNGGFSMRIRRSSLTTSRSVTKVFWSMRSDAMRSASIHSTSGRYCAGMVCQNTVVSSLV